VRRLTLSGDVGVDALDVGPATEVVDRCRHRLAGDAFVSPSFTDPPSRLDLVWRGSFDARIGVAQLRASEELSSRRSRIAQTPGPWCRQCCSGACVPRNGSPALPDASACSVSSSAWSAGSGSAAPFAEPNPSLASGTRTSFRSEPRSGALGRARARGARRRCGGSNRGCPGLE
jgi:hypothetical protein